MVAIIEVLQLLYRLIKSLAQCLGKNLHIRFHLRQKFCLADTADGRILTKHADVIQIINLTEDAQLRELGDTRNKSKFQPWVEILDWAIEVFYQVIPFDGISKCPSIWSIPKSVRYTFVMSFPYNLWSIIYRREFFCDFTCETVQEFFAQYARITSTKCFFVPVN